MGHLLQSLRTTARGARLVLSICQFRSGLGCGRRVFEHGLKLLCGNCLKVCLANLFASIDEDFRYVEVLFWEVVAIDGVDGFHERKARSRPIHRGMVWIHFLLRRLCHFGNQIFVPYLIVLIHLLKLRRVQHGDFDGRTHSERLGEQFLDPDLNRFLIIAEAGNGLSVKIVGSFNHLCRVRKVL